MEIRKIAKLRKSNLNDSGSMVRVHAHGELVEQVMNRGSYYECCFGAELNGSHKKDNNSFDMSADVTCNGVGYSVKSFGASLTGKLTCNDQTEENRQKLIGEFFQMAKADKFVYIIDVGEPGKLDAYILERPEFQKLVNEFVKLRMTEPKADEPEPENGEKTFKLRFGVADSKVQKFFEKEFGRA